MAFIVSADLHLRHRTWNNFAAIEGDAFAALAQITTYCLEKVAGLILAGDTFHEKRPEAAALHNFCQQMSRMGDLPVLTINGNHDEIAVAEHALPLLARQATSINRTTYDLGHGCLAYGLDYQPGPTLRDEFAAIPSTCSVLICHQSWQEIQRVGHTDAATEMLPPHVTCVVTGDNHVHGVFYGKNSGGRHVALLSPGCPFLHNRGEAAAQKGFFIIRGSPRGVEYQHRSIAVRPYCHVEIRSEAELCALQEQLAGQQLPRNSVGPALVDVSYDMVLADAYARLMAVRGDYPLVVEPLPTEAAPAVLPETTSDNNEMLQQALRSMGADDVSLRVALAVLANPAATTLDALRTHFLTTGQI